MTASIVLTTLNAKYSHSSLGLRYLYANLKEYQCSASIQEYIITDRTTDVVDKILSAAPTIIGIGVYIWNALPVKSLVETLKKIAPQIVIVLGGPEVSHAPCRVDFSRADYIIQGEGEVAFYALVKQLLNQQCPVSRIIRADMLNLECIALPYDYYSQEDVLQRVIYVETTRGCPFSCEFCLSSMDNKVREFDLDLILMSLETLWQRGVRKFKFVDRTFNLNIARALRILDYFLQKPRPYFIHFELVPELFPPELKDKLALFEPAALQCELGVQTLDAQSATLIKRTIDVDKIKQNLVFLDSQTNAHLHVDLIVGLPNESIEQFAANFNTLTSLTKAEIQVGFLKKLSGTSLARHDQSFAMIYMDEPPYEILQTSLISFVDMQKMKRFARFWDLIYNSGNFKQTACQLWEKGEAFEGFYAFVEWISTQTSDTWKISLNRLAALLFEYLNEYKQCAAQAIAQSMVEDLSILNGRALPSFLKKDWCFMNPVNKINGLKSARRQNKHINT